MIYATTVYAKHLKVGYSNEAMQQYSAKDVTIATNVWLQQLVADSNNTATFSFYSDKGLAKAAKDGKADYLSAYGLAYVKYFDLSKLHDAFSGGSADRRDENLILVLPQGVTKKQFLRLQHPKIAMLRGNELAKLYTNYIFLKSKNHTKIKFDEQRTNYRALLNLFFHKADAAVVMKKTFAFASELNPQIAKSLYISEKTNLCDGNFGFFTSRVDPAFTKEIKALSLALNHTKRGKQVLDIFRAQAVIVTKVSQLKPIEDLYHNYLKLKKKEEKHK